MDICHLTIYMADTNIIDIHKFEVYGLLSANTQLLGLSSSDLGGSVSTIWWNFAT